MRPASLLFVAATAAALSAAACANADEPGGTEDAASGDDDDDDDADAAVALPTFQRCVGRPFEPGVVEAWQSVATYLVVAGAQPAHSAEDRVVATDAALELRAKLGYGALSTNLDGERVRVYLDDCLGWRDLGVAVTASGRVAVAGPTDLAPGMYETVFEVAGDLSTTRATAWVLPPGSHLAVTDIDGTLTSSDTELFLQILNGSYVPAAYPGAAELTQAHATLGHVVVYLTGRPFLLSDVTRTWLSELGFTAGAAHLTDNALDSLPTDAAVGAYKTAWLQSLRDSGFVLDLAYGNATTDITAYLANELPPEQVWIIGSNAGASGTNAVTDTWLPRVAEVEGAAPVVQPFSW